MISSCFLSVSPFCNMSICRKNENKKMTSFRKKVTLVDGSGVRSSHVEMSHVAFEA